MTLKILHLIDSGGLYGAEKMLLSLVDEQLRQGLDPLVVSAGEPGIEEKAIEREARLRGLPVISWRMKPGFNVTEGLKVLKWAKEQNVEVLHSHGYKFNILLGVIPKRWRRIPMISTVHGYVHATRFTKMWIYEILDHIAIRLMDRIVIVSEAMKSEFASKSVRKRMHQIPNGIDINATKRRAEEPPNPEVADFLDRHDPVILGVGRLSPEKQFEMLIEALVGLRKIFPNCGLLILGEGRQRYALSELAVRHQLDAKVMLAGFVENVPSVMSRCDCLAMPSKTEGMPITALEAMAVGLPIVASDVGALPQVLEGGKAGVVLRLTHSDQLAEALHQCFQQSEETERRLLTAQSVVQAKYSTNAMSNAYQEIYKGMAI